MEGRDLTPLDWGVSKQPELATNRRILPISSVNICTVIDRIGRTVRNNRSQYQQLSRIYTAGREFTVPNTENRATGAQRVRV